MVDPNTLIGYFITAAVSILGSFLLFRGSLAAMASNAFDVAKKATATTKEVLERIERMELIMNGKMRITGEFDMGDLLRDGVAPMENGKIEMLKRDDK